MHMYHVTGIGICDGLRLAKPDQWPGRAGAPTPPWQYLHSPILGAAIHSSCHKPVLFQVPPFAVARSRPLTPARNRDCHLRSIPIHTGHDQCISSLSKFSTAQKMPTVLLDVLASSNSSPDLVFPWRGLVRSLFDLELLTGDDRIRQFTNCIIHRLWRAISVVSKHRSVHHSIHLPQLPCGNNGEGGGGTRGVYARRESTTAHESGDGWTSIRPEQDQPQPTSSSRPKSVLGRGPGDSRT